MKDDAPRFPPGFKRLADLVTPAVYLAAMAMVIGRLEVSLYLKIASAVVLAAFGLLTLSRPGEGLGRGLQAAVLTLGIGGLAAVLGYRLNSPWIDHHGFNGAVWSLFARVIDRHGFIATHGLCYWTGGSVFDPAAAVYDHHPPGLVWLLALAFKVGGVHEAVARAVPALFSLAGAVSLVALLTKRMGSRAGAAVLPVLLATPGFAYFGRMVNFEPIVLCLGLTFYSWLFLKPASRWATVGLLSLVLASPLMGWVGTPFALGAAFTLARRRLGWLRSASLAFALLPLGAFAFSVLYNADGGRSLAGALQRAGSWSGLLRTGGVDYSAWEWFQQVSKNAALLMPWPLWILVVLLPWARLPRRDAPVLVGTLAPFILMIPLMSHAVYVHDYHMLFVWPAAAVAAAGLMARITKPVASLVFALALLYPVATGLRTTQDMHGKGHYAHHQMRAGLSLNAICSPDARVAVINTAGDPAPIVAYYLDRHYQLYPRLDQALATPGWDYYCLLHKYRGLSDVELAALNREAVLMPDVYVTTYFSNHAGGGSSDRRDL